MLDDILSAAESMNWRDAISAGMNKLLSRILKNGTMADFEVFFDFMRSLGDDGRKNPFSAANPIGEEGDRISGMRRIMHEFGMNYLFRDFNSVDDDNYATMLDAGWIPRFEGAHLRWFYGVLFRRYRRDEWTHIDRILADRRLSAANRALLYHAVFDSEVTLSRKTRGFVRMPRLWYYNRSICDRIIEVMDCPEHAKVKKLSVFWRGELYLPDAMESGVSGDRLAVFEMNRQLEDRRVDDAMLEHLIRCDALRCFTGLLSHHPGEVFKLRSPEEWLLTVCRCVKEKFAVAVVDEIARQFPGIVGRTRDPWGNTPLWNTFVNPNPTEKLRAELIRLGCDPDAENEWGLSYRLLKENAPGWYDHENESNGGRKWR